MPPAESDARQRSAATASLSFAAPYVVERLVKDRVVNSLAEAERLFTEVKRYLVLADAHRDVTVGMYSVRVDEAWHAFILHTAQYADFCHTFFGRYIVHAPKNAPEIGMHMSRHRPEVTFDAFRTMYEEFFGEHLPDVWYDLRGITPARRVFNDSAGRLTVTHRDSIAELLDETHDVVVSAHQITFKALEFIAGTGAFYTRELPGELTDDEKVALVQALMSAGILRPAP